VALGTVFTLNAVALYLFPPLGHWLGLSQIQFGTWSGIAIHDLSSVVGAASAYGQVALQTATAVKLSRTLWIMPVALLAGLLVSRAATGHGKASPCGLSSASSRSAPCSGWALLPATDRCRRTGSAWGHNTVVVRTCPPGGIWARIREVGQHGWAAHVTQRSASGGHVR